MAMGENLTTILYYTSNRENPIFEKNITEMLKKTSGEKLPIVSVSQKPIDLGKNICVGERHQCYFNEFRQIQIGLMAINTPYVLVAESDTVYPPEYFDFVPGDANCYHYNNVWVYYNLVPDGFRQGKSAKYWLKGDSHCAQAVKREYWLALISSILGEEYDWFDTEGSKKLTHRLQPMLQRSEHTWTSENPVITFKSVHGTSRYTKIRNDGAYILPYFGTAEELRNTLYDE